MLNQVILVGRLVKDPEIRETSDGKSVSNITLAVSRNYKNAETGEYDTDFLTCTLWEGIAESTSEYCKKGSTVGIKARLAMKKYKYDDEKYFTYPEIIAEKVTFINLNKNDN
ncbi:single-stranded DNA-binding protein [Mycoplasmatota bacterium]|nr:single-stranded DNA-binding protein [Mycoplasmatota bacterium]